MHSAGTRKATVDDRQDNETNEIKRLRLCVFVCVCVGFYLFSFSISCLRLSLLCTFLTSPTYFSCERSRCLAYSVLYKQTTHRQGYAVSARTLAAHSTACDRFDSYLPQQRDENCSTESRRQSHQAMQSDCAKWRSLNFQLIQAWSVCRWTSLHFGPSSIVRHLPPINRWECSYCSVFTSSKVALVLADEAGGSSSRTNPKYRFNLPLLHGMCCVTIGHHTAHTRTHVTHELSIRSLLASDENEELKLGSFHLPPNSFRVIVEKNHRFGSVCCVRTPCYTVHTRRQ